MMKFISIWTGTAQLKCSPTLKFKLLLIICALIVTTSIYAAENQQTALNPLVIELSKIKKLDLRFKKLSSAVYSSHKNQKEAKKILNSKRSNMSIEKLHQKVIQQINRNHHFAAILLIKTNLKFIKNNLDDQRVFDFIKILLKHNEANTAKSLYKQIQSDGEQFYITNAALKFAEYHSQRKEWQQTLKLLNTDLSELSGENTALALILKGEALQRLKKHREAIKIYARVKQESHYYGLAQLNIATAYIRQDWWTDAHIIINKQLKSNLTDQTTELANRLSLILGYSLLSKEYFREARESFRNISLDSQYINKALMGIGLSAFGQGDNIGALNVLSILKDKKSEELVVEECYMLLPHIYKKLEQYMTANAGYSDAINYYQSRINQLKKSIHSINNLNIKKLTSIKNTSLLIANTRLDFANRYPQYFFANINELDTLTKNNSSSKLKSQLSKLNKDYNQLFSQITKRLLNKRIKELQSYLSQSQYGVAQLYDKSDNSSE